MCHCLLCQKRTGSTYSVHAYFPTEKVRVEGTTKVYARKGDSGAYVYFHFCPECGSTIYWEVEASPGKTGVPIGVFADPTFPPPNVSIFVPHKHPWVSVPEGSLRTKDTVRPSRLLRLLRLRAEVNQQAIPLKQRTS
ncbi:MAG: GFA family protein [Caldimonas sp.]